MLVYIARRVLQSFVVVAAVVLIVFLMIFLSGDPAVLMLPPDASQADIDALRVTMGFDQPLYVQFLRYVGDLLQGDLGDSWRLQAPALSLVLERIPATLQLGLSAMLIALAVAFPVGIISAVKSNSWFDSGAMVFALLGQSMPSFWTGIMLILIFAVGLGWLPTSGRTGATSVILPAVALGLTLAGRNARLIRSSMLEVLGEDYIRTARAKGVRERLVVGKHALKNALLPVVTVLGLELGHLLGGAVIVETVFAWPGIGLLAVQAVNNRDFPVVQAVIIISALMFVITNFLIDIFYTWLDPRISLVKP